MTRQCYIAIRLLALALISLALLTLTGCGTLNYSAGVNTQPPADDRSQFGEWSPTPTARGPVIRF